MAAALAGMTSPTGTSQYQPHLQGQQRVLGSALTPDIGLQSTSRDSVGSHPSAPPPGGFFNSAVSVSSAAIVGRGDGAGFTYEPRRTSPSLSLGTSRTHAETTAAEESKQLPSPLSPVGGGDSYAAFAGNLGLLSEATSPTKQQQQQQPQQQQPQQPQQQQQQPTGNGNLTIDQIQRQLLQPEGQGQPGHRESPTSPSPSPSTGPGPGAGPGAGASQGSFDGNGGAEGADASLHVSTRHTYDTRSGQYYPM